VQYEVLHPYGWNDRWRAFLAAHPDSSPARVLRHDGSALLVATPDGVTQIRVRPNVEPDLAVGDWLACRDGELVAVLPRTGLLRRRDVGGDREQPLAANVDVVLLVCGLDRPVKAGRILRGATLAWDAGATPAVVLTKAAIAADAHSIAARVRAEHPTLDVVVTSANERQGVDDVAALVGERTVAMLGESGTGKSSLLNALLGVEGAAVGRVRAGDAKGRHTTTARELHPLPSGGVLIDTPGIRAVGLWVDPGAVAQTFSDIDALAAGCRFDDCGHDSEPGCAVADAVDDGVLSASRLSSWHDLRREAESAARRSNKHEQHAYERRLGRMVKDAQKRKGR
jgi:ribosome biogenesis GTPase